MGGSVFLEEGVHAPDAEANAGTGGACLVAGIEEVDAKDFQQVIDTCEGFGIVASGGGQQDISAGEEAQVEGPDEGDLVGQGSSEVMLEMGFCVERVAGGELIITGELEGIEVFSCFDDLISVEVSEVGQFDAGLVGEAASCQTVAEGAGQSQWPVIPHR